MNVKHKIARTFIYLVYPIARVIFRPITKNYLTVFLFHEVTDTPSKFQLTNLTYTTTQNFQINIDWIDENYKVIDISQIGNLPLENAKPLAVITFDDAWKGQVSASRLISTKHGLPVTLFLNLGAVKSRIDIAALKSFGLIKVPSFNESITLNKEEKLINEEFLNWQGDIMTINEITELDQQDNLTLANHSLHHYPAIDLTEEQFLENVELNERGLAKFDSFKKYYAFTFGRPGIDYKKCHVELLESMQYEYIFSADAKLNRLPLRKQETLSRINFSPMDFKKSDFWWATNKSILLRRF